MSSNDFDELKQDVLSFIEEKHNKCLQVNSLDTFVINELLKHFNSVDKEDKILFQKCLEDIQKGSNKLKKTNTIEISKIIKGDFITFEDYDFENLFQNNNYLNFHFENLNNINNDIEFNESFSDI
tara:strand:+ start:973 stop:1347 length:375 start_codon:yes stop_codon:yes gene_type:complete